MERGVRSHIDGSHGGPVSGCDQETVDATGQMPDGDRNVPKTEGDANGPEVQRKLLQEAQFPCVPEQAQIWSPVTVVGAHLLADYSLRYRVLGCGRRRRVEKVEV